MKKHKKFLGVSSALKAGFFSPPPPPPLPMGRYDFFVADLEGGGGYTMGTKLLLYETLYGGYMRNLLLYGGYIRSIEV